MSAESPSPQNQTEQPSRSPDLALSRHALLAEAFETLALALGPFIDGRMTEYFPDEGSWTEAAANRMGRPAEHGATDPLFQLLVLRRFWGPAFAEFFGEDLRPLIGQIIEARNFWAHFNLPDDTAYLDRILLGIERLVAPVEPDATSGLRRLRTRLKNPVASASDLAPAEQIDTDALQNQLDESERVFGELQEEFSEVARQLEISRKAAAGRQHRISVIEEQLSAIHGRSDILQTYLEQERDTRNRLEWLFVGFIAVMLMVMVIIAG